MMNIEKLPTTIQEKTLIENNKIRESPIGYIQITKSVSNNYWQICYMILSTRKIIAETYGISLEEAATKMLQLIKNNKYISNF